MVPTQLQTTQAPAPPDNGPNDILCQILQPVPSRIRYPVLECQTCLPTLHCPWGIWASPTCNASPNRQHHGHWHVRGHKWDWMSSL